MPPLYGGAGPREVGGREGEQVDSGDGKLFCLINPSLPQGVTRPPLPPPPDARVVRTRTRARTHARTHGLGWSHRVSHLSRTHSPRGRSVACGWL